MAALACLPEKDKPGKEAFDCEAQTATPLTRQNRLRRRDAAQRPCVRWRSISPAIITHCFAVGRLAHSLGRTANGHPIPHRESHTHHSQYSGLCPVANSDGKLCAALWAKVWNCSTSGSGATAWSALQSGAERAPGAKARAQNVSGPCTTRERTAPKPISAVHSAIRPRLSSKTKAPLYERGCLMQGTHAGQPWESWQHVPARKIPRNRVAVVCD